MTTRIEWADSTWNPITGCTPVSEACDHCYAKRMATRLAGRYGYPKDEPFRVTFHPGRLEEPLRWKKPRRVFVCSMGDLFHEDINFRGNKIRDIFRIIAASDSIFMLLTKRPQRMAECIEFLYGDGFRGQMPNVWLGTTIENQRHDDRILALQQTPAAVRFVSFEPLLGPFDFLPPWLRFIDWVICGGETGPGARPMELAWARDLRDQCKAAGVPFFFKKVGGGRETPEDLNIREVPS